MIRYIVLVVIIANVIISSAWALENRTHAVETGNFEIADIFPEIINFDGQICYYEYDGMKFNVGKPFPFAQPEEFLKCLEPLDNAPAGSVAHYKAWIRNDSLKYLQINHPLDMRSSFCAFYQDTVDAIYCDPVPLGMVAPVLIYRWLSIYENSLISRLVRCCPGESGCASIYEPQLVYKGDRIYEITDFKYFPEAGELKSKTKYRGSADIDNHDWRFRVEYDEDGNCVFFESKTRNNNKNHFCPRPNIARLLW